MSVRLCWVGYIRHRTLDPPPFSFCSCLPTLNVTHLLRRRGVVGGAGGGVALGADAPASPLDFKGAELAQRLRGAERGGGDDVGGCLVLFIHGCDGGRGERRVRNESNTCTESKYGQRAVLCAYRGW